MLKNCAEFGGWERVQSGPGHAAVAIPTALR